VLSRSQIPIAGDRIAAYYHVRQSVAAPSLSDHIRRITKLRRKPKSRQSRGSARRSTVADNNSRNGGTDGSLPTAPPDS
jgi:hypothetical protein